MAFRKLRSVLAMLCLLSTVHAFESLFFLKFHKVGSTTAALALSHVAQEAGFIENCEGGGPRTACVEHTSLFIMSNTSLAATPLERIEVLFPSPLTITLLRHPVEKLLSRLYYDCAGARARCDEEGSLRALPHLWRTGGAEYAPVLGGDADGNIDLRLAIRTLESFTVVGVTESMSSLFVQVAYHLRRPISDFVFRSAKVIDGRPTYDDLLDSVKSELNQLMVKNEYLEVQIYRTAEKIDAERVAKWQLELDIIKLEEMAAELDTGECDTSAHSSGGAGLHGQWCMELPSQE